VAAWIGATDIAADCYARALPHAHRFLNSAVSCYGAIARPLGEIAAVLGDPAAEAHLAEAVRMEERNGAPSFAALARLAQARHLRATDHRRAGRLAEQVLVTARRLGMPKVAAEAAGMTRDMLTAREREIAGLVAEGLANRVIAERLFLSERTVETHVRHVLAKLGLPDRTGLRGASQYRY
jgi:DNA-binding NarL/FixJ family response regulator